MINLFLFKIQLRKLRWKRFWIEYSADKMVKKLREKGLSQEEAKKSRQEFGADYFDIVNEIEKLKTKYMLMKADVEMVPLPDLNNQEMWKKDIYQDQDVLTEKGFNEIRKTIRSELKDRHSLFIPWITLLLSLIAAIASVWNAFAKG